MSKKLIIQNNHLKDLDKLTKFHDLWIIDLSNNLIECVKGISEIVCLGGLDLSNNRLGWVSLESIKQLFIIDLKLHGNPCLEADGHYRHHLVDIFTRVFCLDQQFINAVERVNTAIFFDKSNFDEFPIRHHTNINHFRSTSSKSLRYYGKYSKNAFNLLRQFPDVIPLTEEWDKKKIIYVTEFAINDVISSDDVWIRIFVEKLLFKIDDIFNITQLYVLTTLFIANIEFGLNEEFILDALKQSKLNFIHAEQCSTFLQLPKEKKLMIITVFLAILSLANNKPKIQKEFISELYHAMSNVMWIQVRLKSVENIENLFSQYHNEKLKTIYWLSRSILAAETFILISNYENIITNIQHNCLKDILNCATGQSNFSNTILLYSELIGNEEVINIVLGEIRSYIERIMCSYTFQIVEGTNKLKRTVSSKFAQKMIKSTDNLFRGYSSNNVSSNQNYHANHYKDMEIGDKVLLGSQTLARVLSVPGSNSVLVQVIASPVVNIGRFIKPKKTHNSLQIDKRSFEWSSENEHWIPQDSIGDKVFIYKKPQSQENAISTKISVKKVEIDIARIQLSEESIIQGLSSEDTKVNRLTIVKNKEISIPHSTRNSSSKSTQRIKKLVTPNPADILFSNSKNCLSVGSESPNFYAQYPISSRSTQRLSKSFSRVPQTDTTSWLGEGGYIYKKTRWHSKNPINIKKRLYYPGWLKEN